MGISQHESQPSFQSGKVNGASTTNRVTPDVSIDADMSTGMYVINTTTHTTGGGLFPDGGTSFGAPMWAGLIALADQDRALNSLATLSTGAAQSALYGLPAAAFRDVTAGNNGYAAATGYDMASGLGTPLANVLVPALAGVSTTTPHLVLSGTPSSTIIAGGTSGLPSFTADIENTSNAIITSDNSAVTLSVYYDGLNNGAELTSGNVTVNASSGIATFSGLWLSNVPNQAGNYVLQATDGNDVAATFNFTVVAAEPRSGISGTPLAPISGSSSSPSGGLTLSGGVLYGATQQGGPATIGSVYEVSNGTFTTLYPFPLGGADGSDPNGSLVIDSSGDIWGTTHTGGDSGQDGTVFELSESGTLLLSIPLSYSSTGSGPVGGLVADTAGDLFGVTTSGGASGAGTIFEINHGATTISHVLPFDGGALGASPLGGLTMDAAGNLYGTTASGLGFYGTSNGTLFEVKNANTTVPGGTGAITTLASFDGTDQGGSPRSAVAVDAAGNIYGTTYEGGANLYYGTVFEYNADTGLLSAIASFNSSGYPYDTAGVVLDANDNIYGTTEGGGVFEIPAGSNTISTINSLGGTLGNTPLTGVILDNHGNLYGATSSGGSGSGVTFKLSAVALPGWLKPGSAGVWDGSMLTVDTPPGSGSTASVNFGEAIVIQDPDATPFSDVPNLYVHENTGTVAHVQFQGTPAITFAAFNAHPDNYSLHIGNLDLENGATAAIETTTVSDTLGLVVTGLTINGGSQFDMANNRMLVNYASGTDPMPTILGYLKTGYDGGKWDGPGMITSAGAANTGGHTGIGYADSADLQGVNTDPNTIELEYALYGDANLDHQVNSADLQIELFGLNHPGAWDQGDFNYDGNVNSADLQDVLYNLNTNGPS